MTVSYVSQASAAANTLTLPSHQAGDLLVMLAMRYSSPSPGTIPSTWVPRWLGQHNGSFVISHLAVAYRIAASSAETSGTWTNFTHLLCAVYRDDANYLVLNAPMYNRGTGTSVTFSAILANPALSRISTGSFGTQMAQNTGWLIGVAGTHLNNAGIDAPPSGMVNRGSRAGASNGRIALHDTDSKVSSWTAASTTVASSTDWMTNVVEIIDTGFAKITSGGGFRAVNIRGGADQ
jgi:hypothetical protein